VTDSEMNLSLERGEYRLYTDKVIEQPELSTSLNERSDMGLFNSILYPNPVHGNIKLSFELKESMDLSIFVYDNIGRSVMKTAEEFYPIGKHEIAIDTSSFEPGLYFCVISTGRNSDVLKFIRK
jgi:hypothetical protein